MRGWRIFRILGIDITVDLSWFFILALMVYSLGFLEFPRELAPRAFRPRADLLSIGLGIATSLLLFGSVLAHELSHSWMAIQRGIPVKRITLFIFGGVAQIAGEPDKPFTEFLIAIMGPLMSVALAALFGAVWLWAQIVDSTRWLGNALTPVILVTGILAQANGSLALFNLAPGFPLDGGRVLRALLWGWSKNIRTATLWATRLGQLIALGLIGLGIIPFLIDFFEIGNLLPFGFSLGNVWYALIGLFLWNAAGDGYRQTLLIDSLRQVTVRQLMSQPALTVAPNISLAEFVDGFLLHRRDQVFAVADELGFHGIIGIDHLRDTPRAQWNTRRVHEMMTPREKISAISPDETAATALMQINAAEGGELAVMEDHHLIGFLGQSELLRFLKLRAD